MTEVINDLPDSKVIIERAANDLDEILERKAQNRMKPVNKLPAEVLSRMFAIGVEADRNSRQNIWPEGRYIAAQELVSHVCSHWRNITIYDSTLWTYIHITRSPYELASLYLGRAGPTTLLDICLDMRPKYWRSARIQINDTKSQAQQIHTLLEFFHTAGANLHRWRSLRICTTHWLPLVQFTSTLNRYGAPVLRLLSWRREMTPDDMIEGTPEPELLPKPCSIFGSSMPNLGELEFFAMPLGFLLHPSSTTFPGLTTLSLSIGNVLYSPSKLGDFLSANPQLQSLDLNTDATRIPNFQPTTRRIRLPSLQSLTIRARAHVPWIACVLEMIDAPMIHRFALHCPPRHIFYVDSDQLAAYIASRRASTNNSSSAIGLNQPSKSFFPSLRELDISSFSCRQDKLAGMLAALPHITHLYVCGKQAAPLGDVPSLLPNLVSLKFCGFVYPHLGDLLRRRTEAGFPIKAIQMHKDFRLHVKGALPETVEVQMYNDPYFQPEYEEMEDEEEDYDSDDILAGWFGGAGFDGEDVYDDTDEDDDVDLDDSDDEPSDNSE